jgi:hypothetical protein
MDIAHAAPASVGRAQRDREGWPRMTDLAPDPVAGSTSTPRRRELERELRERSGLLADIYVAALRVLSDENNPDRIALAAHGFRELMEKIPEFLEVPTPANHESLKPKVQELQGHWTAMVRKTKCWAMGAWTGEIDGHLGGFLKRLPAFFDWFAAHNPLRRAEARKVLQRLNIGSMEVAVPLEEQNVGLWMDLKGYFANAAHHRGGMNPDEFTANLLRLESFLSDRLVPRTFEDFAEIDEIIGGDDDAE